MVSRHFGKGYVGNGRFGNKSFGNRHFGNRHLGNMHFDRTNKYSLKAYFYKKIQVNKKTFVCSVTI